MMIDKIGPTGRFPDGKISKDDDGELAVGLAVSNNRLIVHFGVPVGWVIMPVDHAITFAEMLRAKAKELTDDKNITFVAGFGDGMCQQGGAFMFEMRGRQGMIKLMFERPTLWLGLPQHHAVGLANAVSQAIRKQRN